MKRPPLETAQLEQHFEAMQILLEDLRDTCLAHNADPTANTPAINEDISLLIKDLNELRQLLQLPVPSPLNNDGS